METSLTLYDSHDILEKSVNGIPVQMISNASGVPVKRVREIIKNAGMTGFEVGYCSASPWFFYKKVNGNRTKFKQAFKEYFFESSGYTLDQVFNDVQAYAKKYEVEEYYEPRH